ncbi:hypothetical protein GCM10010174_31170 [Kutzneria viridogrisea]|uniref:Zn-dependent peptidase ImmA (M78 family) n=1 Tax=Kutzneria viridogrisea TaxID=47990 RepID=A0ABR6BR08_9PSEU|nr:Zn-dependent peptidase ImmA (M78 family) [Kutzneria viridogrisea]
MIDRTLDELDWSTPFDVDHLLDQIAERRGKAISLLPAPLPRDGAGGLVIERERDIVIVYDEALAPLQQEHVVMHEAAHVLFAHRGVTLEDLTDEELTELDPDLVDSAHRFAKRDGYSGLDEKVAEITAALIWLRAGVSRSMIPVRHSSPEIAAANERFVAALMRRGTR